MILDSDPDVLRSVGIMLQRLGATAHLAPSVTNALEAVRRESTLHFVLLTHRLPDGTAEGVALAARQKFTDVVITATSVRDVQEYADHALRKPFGSPELSAFLREHDPRDK